jgi:phosphoribosyl 1,2-cyclic phosphodiesterase
LPRAWPSCPPAAGQLELPVLTHVDADHVEGVLKLVDDAGFLERLKSRP